MRRGERDGRFPEVEFHDDGENSHREYDRRHENRHEDGTGQNATAAEVEPRYRDREAEASGERTGD